MIHDIPSSLKEFEKLAIAHEFNVLSNVGQQRLRVISLDTPDGLARIFHPEIRILPLGTQINGSLGLALKTAEDSISDYGLTIFHHVLNYSDLSKCKRILEDTEEMKNFLRLLKAHLRQLPNSAAEIVQLACQEDSWFAKQVGWRRASALALLDRAKSMTVK